MASPPPKAPEPAKAKGNSDAANEEKAKARRRIFAKFALEHTSDADGQDSCIPSTLVPVALRQLGYFPSKKVSEEARNGATWTTFEKQCDREEKRRHPTEADFVAALKTIAKSQRNKNGSEPAKNDDNAQKEPENEPTCVRLQILKNAFTTGPDALQGEELEYALTLAAKGIVADNEATIEADKENPNVSIDSLSKVLANPPPPSEQENKKESAAAGSPGAASTGQPGEENKNDQQRAESTGNGSAADGKSKEENKNADSNGQAAGAGKENNNSSNNSGTAGNGAAPSEQEQKPREQSSSDSKSKSAPPPEKKEEEKKGCCATM